MNLSFSSLLTTQSNLQPLSHSPIHKHIHTLIGSILLKDASTCSRGPDVEGQTGRQTDRHTDRQMGMSRGL